MYQAIIWQILRNETLFTKKYRRNILVHLYHNELLICFPKRSKGGKGERGENVSGTSTESSYLIHSVLRKNL